VRVKNHEAIFFLLLHEKLCTNGSTIGSGARKERASVFVGLAFTCSLLLETTIVALVYIVSDVYSSHLFHRTPNHICITQRHKMPVPKRRKSQGASSLMALPSYALRLFDIDYVFSKTRFLLLWGFAPTVVLIGMMTEPTPSSWFDIINLLE
jgi:hypothetical protein